MSRWIERGISLPFDTSPIEGLQNLDGNQIAWKYKQEHSRDKKYTLITFPSGVEREILTLRGEEQNQPHIHIFGRFNLPYHHNRDQAYDFVSSIQEEHNLHVGRVGERGLIISNPLSTRSYRFTYDNQENHIADMQPFPKHAMELMTGEIRAALPPFYAQENKGKQAVAPVKFFTPDANWTWYATEFDGEDRMFGLVSGFEVELGYFLLTELESVRGSLGLPIERDLYYEPQTIGELIDYHKNMR